VELFELLAAKLVISNDDMMADADLKDEDTLDDADTMTFTQYRK
jgi:hypothetical protein